ncbi:hypothetical protein J6590_021131 [Homalodisca vitripennis]|nr:hypothetical protein J6590_021131 [Homalodisca vitripennis]
MGDGISLFLSLSLSLEQSSPLTAVHFSCDREYECWTSGLWHRGYHRFTRTCSLRQLQAGSSWSSGRGRIISYTHYSSTSAFNNILLSSLRRRSVALQRCSERGEHRSLDSGDTGL